MIQWFLSRLSQKIRRHISLETFKTYEEALTKALQVEMDEDYPTYPSVDAWTEEKLEIMQKYLRELNLKGQNIQCTKFYTVGHTKDNYRQDVRRQDIRFVQTKCFCDICQEPGDHTTKDFPYNMKNGKYSWFAIYEVKSHETADCHLNLKNRLNYQAVYQTNVVA